ncbi:hypothetical protein [Nannocystis sp. SCPEA4]|uniref:hypothetical protein n=1 Tax=Nannocystis sp. SCPEA4 TaxID=2996787 RepID=UPI00226EE309|nr:hypothetical protein [Nannocystis sp. SCPEA4]MCY1059815.1 hypothetical protein [Nannocystis sp. SCPEA4]
MLSRLHTSLLSSLILVGAACGDNGNNTSATEATSSTTDMTSTEPTTSTTTSGTPTTSTTSPDETTTTTSTEEPTTSTTGTTTGVMPGDCAAPADDADEDGDSIANKDDNCRCDANPNQLDFDGNAVGNVCDAPLVFSIADGAPPEFNKLDSEASASMGLGCTFPVSLVVLGGDVEVQLDDEGTGKVYAATVNIADTPQLECDIALIVNVKLVIKNLVITGPDAFTVGFPFTVADHNSGMVTGMMDMIHNILVNGVIDVQESSNEQLAMPGESPLEDVPGSFPVGTVTVVNDAGQVTLDFNNDNHVVFMQTTMGGLEVKLTGLTGKLRLRQ